MQIYKKVLKWQFIYDLRMAVDHLFSSKWFHRLRWVYWFIQ